MSVARLAELPEDILAHILSLVAEDCLRQDDGFKRWCKLATALPRLSSLLLPRAPLKQLTRRDLPWGGVKWALLRQPSASLLHLAVQRKGGRDGMGHRYGILRQKWRVHTWRGPTHEEEEEGDEEAEAVVEVSENKRGFRTLGLRFFPRYDDDAEDFSVPRASQRLRPWVSKLVQLGVAELRGLRLNADMIACPKVLCQLALRHLELELTETSMSHLEEIMAALHQCYTLEYISIGQFDRDFLSPRSTNELPDLCLCKAPNLKHVHLRACFPEGRLCLPPGCQVRLDLDSYPYSWERKWESKYGRILGACIPTMCLDINYAYGRPWLSHMQCFKALQYLELSNPPQLTDLAMLQQIPHVKLKLNKDKIQHTAGSWQSLEIHSYNGFCISFADVDAFVRDNARYLFISGKGTQAWRNMRDSLNAASEREGVAFFNRNRTNGSYHDARLSSIEYMIDLMDPHLVYVDDFWPEACMWSCLNPKILDPKGDVAGERSALRRPRQLYDSSSEDSHWNFSSDSEFEAEAEFEPEAGSEMYSDSELDYNSDASLETQSSIDRSEYGEALSEWEAPYDLDHVEDARQLPFWGCLTWHDAALTIGGAQYEGNTQLQALYEVCSFVGHSSRENYMTWNDV